MTSREQEVYAANWVRLCTEGSLKPYIGQWMALTRDGTAIVANARELADLKQDLATKGVNLGDIVLEYIDDEDEDTIFVGGA